MYSTVRARVRGWKGRLLRGRWDGIGQWNSWNRRPLRFFPASGTPAPHLGTSWYIKGGAPCQARCSAGPIERIPSIASGRRFESPSHVGNCTDPSWLRAAGARTLQPSVARVDVSDRSTGNDARRKIPVLRSREVRVTVLRLFLPNRLEIAASSTDPFNPDFFLVAP
jgi:hypothetical protein